MRCHLDNKLRKKLRLKGLQFHSVFLLWWFLQGEESGVEILVNEPYTNGPGPGGTSTNGQYTHKIYHIGSHLPAWFKSLLPKSALSAEEKAWNAYPYTKTIFTCPFVDK